MECPICSNNEFLESVPPYIKCDCCYHEFQIPSDDVSFIVNDILSLKEMKKIGGLDKYKIKVSKKCIIKNDFIFDVGSASGKFLYQIKDVFKEHLGLEITKDCIDFSKTQLGLNISDNIMEFNDKIISLTTFWHSLEHIPIEQIEKILDVIKRNSEADTRIIISVPNRDSLLYHLFKDAYAFFDKHSHIHQFSLDSLDLLLSKFSFVRDSSFFSMPYSFFGYMQSFLNKFNKIHNFLYFYLKRDSGFEKKEIDIAMLVVYNLMLAPLFLLPTLGLCIFDVLNKQRGVVLTVCYRKRH